MTKYCVGLARSSTNLKLNFVTTSSIDVHSTVYTSLKARRSNNEILNIDYSSNSVLLYVFIMLKYFVLHILIGLKVLDSIYSNFFAVSKFPCCDSLLLNLLKR